MAAVKAAEQRFVPDLGISVHWGRKNVGGKPTSRSAVVITVPKKMTPTELKRRGIPPIPKTLTFVAHGRRVSAPTDVRVRPKRPARFFANTDTAAPGANVPIGNGPPNPLGTLGAVIDVDGQPYAITAGHVVQAAGARPLMTMSRFFPSVSLGNPRTVIVDDRGDIALLGPLSNVPNGLTAAQTFLRDPSPADVHHDAWISTARDFQPLHVTIDAVNRPRDFRSQTGQGVTVAGLTVVERFSASDCLPIPGDSGAPMFDSNGYLIGFVVGGDDEAVFIMPARRGVYEL